MNEHKISLDELFVKLNSSSEGLSSNQVERRIKKSGLNILETKHKDSAIFKFLSQFLNFFSLLLLTGAVLAFFAEKLSPGDGNIYIGIALFSVVILNSIFTFIQEYQSEKIMESFKKMMPDKVDVLRDKKWIQIESKYLVLGDIIQVNEGDKVPVDARLIEENLLKVDNSSITGESEPQLRKLECTSNNILESRNMIFSGTLVQSGNGKAIVTKRGMDTQIGDIIKLTKETKQVETPLRKELKHFIKIISIIAISLGFIFFIISILMGKQLIGSIIFAIGIIVANVPEGLLPTVTLSLTLASKRMAKKNALVKNLESVETLGSTTVICTDKTGTLTQNNMKVNSFYLDFKSYNLDDKDLNNSPSFDKLILSSILCNNSKLEYDKFLGDPTETSLMDFAKNYVEIPKLISDNKRVHETPFDSVNKRMITTNLVNSNLIGYMKGAPEIIVDRCSKILENGKIRNLSIQDKKDILDFYEKFAENGERVLGFAFKDTKTEKCEEQNFIFLGLIGMVDPPRKEIPQAILKCKNAGIKVVMVTGDYGVTAVSIAKKIGLVANNPTLILGEQLNDMTNEQLREILKKDELIFARTSPQHKLKIVKAFQENGEIITMTGDGVNDAPALKNADMGVAMGKSGTEVARQASDMVLMDDNFATIVSAIEEGRTIYDNIKKFIAYILTSNVPEILPFIFYVLIAIPLPLTVVLILAIDLGTDLIPALGLAVEKPEEDIMKKKPRLRTERLLSKKLLFMSYGIVGIIQAAAGFATYFYILISSGWSIGEQLSITDPIYLKAISGFFVSIIICQIADVLICRTRRESIFKIGFFKNKLVLVGILTEILLIWIIIFSSFGNKYLSTAPLSLIELSISIPFALFIFFGDEFRKLLIRKNNQFVIKYLSW